MRTIKLYDGTPLPVMGLGTWAMGGRSNPDPSQDRRALEAIKGALEIGYTHIDTAEMYANCHTEELVGQAIRGVDRSKLFLTTKVRPPNLSYKRTLTSTAKLGRCRNHTHFRRDGAVGSFGLGTAVPHKANQYNPPPSLPREE